MRKREVGIERFVQRFESGEHFRGLSCVDTNERHPPAHVFIETHHKWLYWNMKGVEMKILNHADYCALDVPERQRHSNWIIVSYDFQRGFIDNIISRVGKSRRKIPTLYQG